MNRLNVQTVRVSAAAILLTGLLLAPAQADDEAPPAFKEVVVPEGQEELLSAMLGRGKALPDKCKFAGGTADGPIILANYTCPSGTIVLELVHPSNAGANATETERFAIAIESGAPPEGLTDTVASLIHSREGEFEWTWLTEGEGGSDHGGE